MFEAVKIGIVSVSDRASSGVYEDKGLPALQDWFGAVLANPAEYVTRLIPDEQPLIERTLIERADNPRNATVRFYRGYLALAQGQRAKAHAWFAQAAALGEGRADAQGPGPGAR